MLTATPMNINLLFILVAALAAVAIVRDGRTAK